MPNQETLEKLLAPLDNTTLECDGFARIASAWLKTAGIEHTVFFGSIKTKDKSFYPHFWIDVDDLRIDYRARMWLGDEPIIPNGVFAPFDYPEVGYCGKPIIFNQLSAKMITMLYMVNRLGEAQHEQK